MVSVDISIFQASLACRPGHQRLGRLHTYKAAHHDVKGVDAGDVHRGKQDNKVGQKTAGSGEQGGRRPVCLGGVVGPVDVAAAVHLQRMTS